MGSDQLYKGKGDIGKSYYSFTLQVSLEDVAVLSYRYVMASRQRHKGVIPFHERNHCFELFLLEVFITQGLHAIYRY